jgi:hypothetical protein
MGNYNRDSLLKDLRINVMKVYFTKLDGTESDMICTLDPAKLPPVDASLLKAETEFHESNKRHIAVWNIQKQAWRSFIVDNVSYVERVDGY